MHGLNTLFRLLTPAILPALAFAALSAPASASEPKKIAEHGNWSSYEFTDSDGSKVCYIVSKPSKDEGKYSKRGEIFALITHRPGDGTKNVFSYIAGYPYKAGSDATIKIDDKEFTLFTQDETAWSPDAETDNAIAAAIGAGSTMTVKGVSKKGTATVDTFSLKGSSTAFDDISKACGI